MGVVQIFPTPNLALQARNWDQVDNGWLEDVESKRVSLIRQGTMMSMGLADMPYVPHGRIPGILACTCAPQSKTLKTWRLIPTGLKDTDVPYSRLHVHCQERLREDWAKERI